MEQVGERRQELGKEIAALEAKMVALQPDFEREQHRWEADVLQQASPARTGGAEVPRRIRTILELEPSEREPAQREEVAAFFRPLSKTLGDICRRLAAQRAALAALRPEK